MARIIEFEDNGQLTPEGAAVANDIATGIVASLRIRLEEKVN